MFAVSREGHCGENGGDNGHRHSHSAHKGIRVSTVCCMFRVFEMLLNIAHNLSSKDALSLGNAQLLLRDLFQPFVFLKTPIFLASRGELSQGWAKDSSPKLR